MKKYFGVSYAYGVGASNLTSTQHGTQKTIGDQSKDLKNSSQTWHDIAYTDSKAKSLYNYALLLNCVANQS